MLVNFYGVLELKMPLLKIYQPRGKIGVNEVRNVEELQQEKSFIMLNSQHLKILKSVVFIENIRTALNAIQEQEAISDI